MKKFTQLWVLATALLAMLVGPAVSASAAPTFGSGSSGSADAPIVGEVNVGNTLEWNFAPTSNAYTASVRVDPDDQNETYRHCVNDRTGGFDFQLVVGSVGASREDTLKMDASQSIFDGCFTSASIQTWTMNVKITRSGNEVYSSNFSVRYRYQANFQRVTTWQNSGPTLPIEIRPGFLIVSPPVS